MGKFLSPEELAERLENLEQPEMICEQRIIPRYKVVRNYTLIFLAGLVALVTLFMNLDTFGYHYYGMLSDSMADQIPKGSFILEKEVLAKQLEEGDIITFVNESGITVTHEIISVVSGYSETEKVAFQTKGSNNDNLDATLVQEEQILGKVIFHIPLVGNILMYPKQQSQ